MRIAMPPSIAGFCPQVLMVMALLWLLAGNGLAGAQAPWSEKPLDTVEMSLLGKKYPQLPKEERLERLESQLNTNAPPDASYQYRVNQVLTAQQVATTQAGRESSVKAYNRAIDEAAQGHTEAAMADYRTAIALNPGLLQAYNNLANLQEKKRLYDDAAATYQQALTIAPNEPLLHFNLAVIQEKQGKIVPAYDHYRQYVSLSSSPNPQIVELIRNFDAKRLSSKGSPDYYSLTNRESSGERLTWPLQEIPIPVFIQLSDQTQAAFISNLYQDFDTWSQVTGGYLRFREVSDPQAAKILITLQAGPLMDANASIGHASFDARSLNAEFPMKVLKVRIVINTGEPDTDLSLDNRREQVGKVALHELGHAIGIWGHSQDPGDIMYTHPIVSQLSNRDINTVRRLYGLKAGR